MIAWTSLYWTLPAPHSSDLTKYAAACALQYCRALALSAAMAGMYAQFHMMTPSMKQSLMRWFQDQADNVRMIMACNRYAEVQAIFALQAQHQHC